jgi:hypothetical protein
MLWKASFWVSVLCIVPYVVYFGFNRENAVAWPLILVLGMILAWCCMYYVLFKATEFPKR